ncbi:TIGR00725 family protein [Methanolobus sp. ZRKC3]|uniref:TIGR00725 family protein n=1 Tax=Methanolobus sp. ZRKC3 TaxID=3125786 RepID=UPI00324DC686
MGIQIGVIGAGSCSNYIEHIAKKVGREIANNGAILICGGLGGVMEAASMGAKNAGGTTIGILPGSQRNESNSYIDIEILSNMGHARNTIIAQSCDALIAIDGEYGTLSEIALSLKMGKKVICLESKWNVEGTIKANGPEEAVKLAIKNIENEEN